MFGGARPGVVAGPSTGTCRDATVLDSWVDLGCELVVRAFGTWTVLYHLGVVLGVRTTPLLALTAVLTVLPLLVPWSWRTVRRARARARRAATAAARAADVDAPVAADRAPAAGESEEADAPADVDGSGALDPAADADGSADADAPAHVDGSRAVGPAADADGSADAEAAPGADPGADTEAADDAHAEVSPDVDGAPAAENADDDAADGTGAVGDTDAAPDADGAVDDDPSVEAESAVARSRSAAPDAGAAPHVFRGTTPDADADPDADVEVPRALDADAAADADAEVAPEPGLDAAADVDGATEADGVPDAEIPGDADPASGPGGEIEGAVTPETASGRADDADEDLTPETASDRADDADGDVRPETASGPADEAETDGTGEAALGDRAAAAAGPAPALHPTADAPTAPRVRHLPGALLLSTGLALAAIPSLIGRDADYQLGWSLAVASVVVLVLALVVAGPVPEQRPRSMPTAARVAATLFVLAVMGTAATASLFTLTKSYDDIFYVNKAVFVAEHGTIPVRDTVYSDQALPAIRGAGSVPMQSIEVLQGAIGHVLGIRGADMAYLVATPVAVAMAVWVLWWLVREWSRGPAIVAFVVGAAYLAWGMYLAPGAGGSIATSSLLLRGSWQGKVVLVCAALPFCHLALTRWARGRRPRDLWLLFLVGAGTVGLASTAVFLMPPIAGAALVALAVTRRRGWWGPLVLAAYPVGAGIVVSRISGGESFGEPLRTAASAFHGLYGQAGWGWLSALALLLGAWAVRRGAGQVVAAAAVVATVVVLVPAAPELVNELTGAGPILWRLGWIPPLAALLGVLAAAPLGATDVLVGRTRRVVEWVHPAVRVTLGVLVAAAAVACIVLVGRPVWAHDAPLQFADRPVWKWTQSDLQVAQAIADGARGPGSVLAPREAMSALALTTTRVHAVDPRSFFLPGLDEDPLAHDARRRLSFVMKPGLPWVFRSFANDLRVVGVGTVCLDPTQTAARTALVRAGWRYDSSFSAPRLTCWLAPSAQEGARSPGAR